jgi:hypothetical protein
MEVVYLTKRWSHHTASGGYDRLAGKTKATVIQRDERAGIWRRVLRSFGGAKATSESAR